MANTSPSPRIQRRIPSTAALLPSHLHPVLRRVYAGRGISQPQDLSLSLENLLSPRLLGIGSAAHILVHAIQKRRRIMIAGDYDADGATASALAVLGLRALGAARVDFVVPDRINMGYGLSPGLVSVILSRGADVLITVDNGIASHAGVSAAKSAGLAVIVTDHHLPPKELPAADAIVNPNQPGCTFPSKNLAGVGVMFYVLAAVRSLLKAEGVFDDRDAPNLAEFLDLVALGTVADVVPLDRNNRVLVAQGLMRMRAGHCRPGLLALLEATGRTCDYLVAQDLGFVLAPRLNAAGRLDSMRVGIECLLAPDVERARPLARQLCQLNHERREIEQQMRTDAFESASNLKNNVGVCVSDDTWHEGIIGLVAARVRERLHRPTIAFAPAAEAGVLRGSGRSIPGLHLRDVLAEIDARNAGLIVRFGGHAMAVGLSLRASALESFQLAFDEICREHLGSDALDAVIETDGELRADELNLDTALALESGGPWGQGFPEPLFDGRFQICDARVIGQDGRHVRYQLKDDGGGQLGAVHFDGIDFLQSRGQIGIVYRLLVNRFQGLLKPELQILHLTPH